MTTHTPIELVEQQDWLEPVETGLQNAVSRVYASAGDPGRRAKNFLHGVWLGHPLHPVLTDIPIGAWTAALVLDTLEASGHRRYAGGADTAIKVGLVGAGAAAVAGLTDWSATDGPARRVGLTHGLLNVTAAALYLASALVRRDDRPKGRALALAGFAIAGVSAWLGGNLVYGKQIGVNHTAGEPMPEQWTDVAAESDVRENEPVRVMAEGVKVLLVRQRDEIRAIAEVCSHLGGPLAEGKVEGETVVCPWHGSRFCLRDGSVIDGPATHPQPRFEVRIIEGRVQVRSWSQE
jgi:nitrite reductase/ring-hydroxylating ferredoxin subunit/uncharacterized membrane protein